MERASMSDRQWAKGANGLWSSFDPVIRRQELRQRAKDRIAQIGERFAAVVARNGLEQVGRNRWRRAA